MRTRKVVGLARVVMTRRERIMMLEPLGKGIMGTTLHYAYEIRGEEGPFEEIPDLKLPAQMVGLAEDIVDKMTGKFVPEEFNDRYEEAMVALIRSKEAGTPVKSQKPTARPTNVVNLLDALRRSVEGTARPSAPPAREKAKARAKPASRRKARG
jgi:DNA end-binding protein Ku